MPSANFDIRDQVVVVTGGATGIGRAVALGLAQAGAHVVIASRDRDKVENACEEIRGLGASAFAETLDVADPDSVRELVKRVAERHGGIDGLFNAAGVTKRVPTMDVSLEDWKMIVDTNLTGTFLVSQAAGRVMRDAGRGAIVNVASLTSFRAFADVAAYGSSKAAVAHLTQSLASDWAQYGIRVNAIAPGVFPTPLNRALIENTWRGDTIITSTPMARFGDPAELVGAVQFLLSPAASFVTGTIVAVDGGFLARGVGPEPAPAAVR